MPQKWKKSWVRSVYSRVFKVCRSNHLLNRAHWTFMLLNGLPKHICNLYMHIVILWFVTNQHNFFKIIEDFNTSFFTYTFTVLNKVDRNVAICSNFVLSCIIFHFIISCFLKMVRCNLGKMLIFKLWLVLLFMTLSSRNGF